MDWTCHDDRTRRSIIKLHWNARLSERLCGSGLQSSRITHYTTFGADIRGFLYSYFSSGHNFCALKQKYLTVQCNVLEQRTIWTPQGWIANSQRSTKLQGWFRGEWNPRFCGVSWVKGICAKYLCSSVRIPSPRRTYSPKRGSIFLEYREHKYDIDDYSGVRLSMDRNGGDVLAYMFRRGMRPIRIEEHWFNDWFIKVENKHTLPPCRVDKVSFFSLSPNSILAANLPNRMWYQNDPVSQVRLWNHDVGYYCRLR